MGMGPSPDQGARLGFPFRAFADVIQELVISPLGVNRVLTRADGNTGSED